MINFLIKHRRDLKKIEKQRVSWNRYFSEFPLLRVSVALPFQRNPYEFLQALVEGSRFLKLRNKR